MNHNRSETCGFSRGCFECEEDATHEIPKAGSFDDERSGIPSIFSTNKVCGIHARAYAHHSGIIPTKLPVDERQQTSIPSEQC